MFSVIDASAGPSIRWTTFTSAPTAIAMLAAVRRRALGAQLSTVKACVLDGFAPHAIAPVV